MVIFNISVDSNYIYKLSIIMYTGIAPQTTVLKIALFHTEMISA